MLESGEAVRAHLGDIHCPTCIITSRQDHVVTPTDSDVIADQLGGPVERLWLEKSFHVATLDYDRAEVEATAVAFATRVVGA